ncbi:MAG: 2-hydroxyacyl-CoA dehydratase family protein, partial [Clostridiales bacterium]
GIGLSYAEFEMTNRVFVRPKSKLVLKRNYSNIIKSNYYDDISTSFVFNKNRIDNIMKIIDENQIDGVIYHVLKGHVCYDFELDFIEDIFVKKNIPFFRLETDYNKQDVEQLRIRTEAFFEMLSMKINNVG